MASIHFFMLLFLTCPFLSSCQRANQVILTCGGSNEDPIPGPAGPPGKRGPPGAVGPRGVQGPKGEPGANDTWREALKTLQTKTEALEAKLEANSEILSRVKFKSCQDALARGARSGVYFLTTPTVYQGYCDMETDGGGWLVVQKRYDGSTNFYRDWREYENGFGSLTGEFWLGLDLMHELTLWKPHEIRIDLQKHDLTKHYAKYRNFSIGSSASNYRLSVSGYSGDAGDMLDNHNQMPFSTHDRDHDLYGGVNCAVSFHGAWWYRNCYRSNLNGKYYKEETREVDSNRWDPVSRKRSGMKIRPVM